MKKALSALTICILAMLTACGKSTSTSSSASPSAAPGASASPASAVADTPYQHLPEKPTFTLTSTDVKDGQPLPKAQLSGLFGAGGSDTSPQLSWSGFPPETKSFAVTMYDPDAPTGSGFWHWAVANIPVNVTSLPSGAGSPDVVTLPAGAIQIPNDARLARYVGAAPPKGTGTHRYFITVYALDTSQITIDRNASAALLGSMLNSHTLARAYIVPTATP